MKWGLGSRAVVMVGLFGALGCGGHGGAGGDAGGEIDGRDGVAIDTIGSDAIDSAGEAGDGVEADGVTVEDADAPDGTADADGVDGADGRDVVAPSLRGPCERALRLGGFQITAEVDYAYVEGSVADGVVPVTVLEVVAGSEIGDCRLLAKQNPFCDPPCQPGETCDFEGRCVAYPAPVDLGAVSVDGLLVPVSMTAIEPGMSYFETRVPNPPWVVGAAISLRAGQGAADALELHAVAPATLVPIGSWEVADSGATDLEVRWEPPGEASASSEVVLSMLIDQHGNAPRTLECRFDDTGVGVVPRALIASLIASGVSGFPSGRLVRRSVDSQLVASPVAGCVELVAMSPRSVPVSVRGHIPCRKDADCPSEQGCDRPTETCVPR